MYETFSRLQIKLRRHLKSSKSENSGIIKCHKTILAFFKELFYLKILDFFKVSVSPNKIFSVAVSTFIITLVYFLRIFIKNPALTNTTIFTTLLLCRPYCSRLYHISLVQIMYLLRRTFENA